jgi:hypothetical protein
MLQDERRNPDAEAREDPTNETPEEGNTFEENLSLVNVINNNLVVIGTRGMKSKIKTTNTRKKNPNLVNIFQQNAIMITGREVEGVQHRPDKSNSERWL